MMPDLQLAALSSYWMIMWFYFKCKLSLSMMHGSSESQSHHNITALVTTIALPLVCLSGLNIKYAQLLLTCCGLSWRGWGPTALTGGGSHKLTWTKGYQNKETQRLGGNTERACDVTLHSRHQYSTSSSQQNTFLLKSNKAECLCSSSEYMLTLITISNVKTPVKA